MYFPKTESHAQRHANPSRFNKQQDGEIQLLNELGNVHVDNG